VNGIHRKWTRMDANVGHTGQEKAGRLRSLVVWSSATSLPLLPVPRPWIGRQSVPRPARHRQEAPVSGSGLDIGQAAVPPVNDTLSMPAGRMSNVKT